MLVIFLFIYFYLGRGGASTNREAVWKGSDFCQTLSATSAEQIHPQMSGELARKFWHVCVLILLLQQTEVAGGNSATHVWYMQVTRKRLRAAQKRRIKINGYTLWPLTHEHIFQVFAKKKRLKLKLSFGFLLFNKHSKSHILFSVFCSPERWSW